MKKQLRYGVGILLLLILASPSFAFTEKEYQAAWCPTVGGTQEVVLDDRTRVDCLTEDEAIEIDFAYKWYECIGQSLHYARKTGKRPACALIMHEYRDQKRIANAMAIATCERIKIYVITNDIMP